MNKISTSARLQEYMKKNKFEQVDILTMVKPVAEAYGIRFGKSDLSQYVSGKVVPGQEKLAVLSKALNVSEVWLMGYNIEKEVQKQLINRYQAIPIVDTITNGKPILTEENIIDYFNIDNSIKADFGLKVKSDSMINIGINKDDLAFIKKQCTLKNGEIGAFLIENEVTLKRFYKQDHIIILQSENSKYRPIVMTNSYFKILGKLVGHYRFFN